MAAAQKDDTYDPTGVESVWQARWANDRLLETDVDHVAVDQKFYNLVEFPYPSAEGLHVGHAYTYAGADTYGRYLRMRGREVFSRWASTRSVSTRRTSPSRVESTRAP